MAILKAIRESYNKSYIKKLDKIVDKIEAFEKTISALSDEELKEKTQNFRYRILEGASLDAILPEAFAVVREASSRVLGMRQFRVQLLAGIVLHQGDIAEMKTGEGKTLVALAPAYLNALSGNGVHIVTTNDYLAKRDRLWMGKVLEFLGMEVGCITTLLSPAERATAYKADVTYGTATEFGFDYLRDNMAQSNVLKVQRPYNFIIIDEVDSILIDEARIPLIISGTDKESSKLYEEADKFIRMLDGDAVEVNRKEKTAFLTDTGITMAEKYFNVENISDLDHVELNHNIRQALYAHKIMRKDFEYIVQDGEVLCIDENTGRIAVGRRYSNGLHQAIEIKEGLQCAAEQKTLATITLQNYVKMYPKASGMTGTAMTEETEFNEIYNLRVIAIPTNKPIRRIDHDDVIYRTEKAKYNAIVEDIVSRHEKGQPILVGTESIEVSEIVSILLKKRGIPHSVLNAKHHAKEAAIIAQAGVYGAVTIATNMAGRGTDIVLGGNPEAIAKSEISKLDLNEEGVDIIVRGNSEIIGQYPVLADARNKYMEILEYYKEKCSKSRDKVLDAGGLYVLGVSRHSSRRIDNQLRGRSGRQGDVGESRFYISLEDELVKLFGGERLQALSDKLGFEDDVPLSVKMLSNSIEYAQKKVEGMHYQSRKNVLAFDDVMNKQRKVIYEERDRVLSADNMEDETIAMIEGVAERIATAGGLDSFSYDFEALENALEKYHLRHVEYDKNDFFLIEYEEKIKKVMIDMYLARLEELKKSSALSDIFKESQRQALLKVVDVNWCDHLATLEYLKTSVSIYGHFQQDPFMAYRNESSNMFDMMIAAIQDEYIEILMSVLAKPDPHDLKETA